MKKVFVTGYEDYYEPFKSIGPLEKSAGELYYHPENIALVVMIGGADVGPDIYGHRRNSKTHTDEYTDKRELKVIEFAIKNNIPLAGICKGGQMLISYA